MRREIVNFQGGIGEQCFYKDDGSVVPLHLVRVIEERTETENVVTYRHFAVPEKGAQRK